MTIVKSNFSGSPFRFSGHAETILPAIFRRVTTNWKRKRIETLDMDFIDLDFVQNGNSKCLLLLHGLEGSSNSGYIKGFANYFSEKGFDICTMNFRSCSGVMNNKLYSYHSGKTDDLDFIIQYLIRQEKYKQIGVAGFSLGGNVTLLYAGKNAINIPNEVKTFVAISAPLNLRDSAIKMAEPGNKVYMQRFLSSLNRKMELKAKQFPGEIDISGIRNIKTFHQFDDRFTGPIHGFKNADDYYKKCSAINVLVDINKPSLLINAKNDPFLNGECLPLNSSIENATIIVEYPKYGGHVGFSENLLLNKFYTEKRVYDFMIKHFLK